MILETLITLAIILSLYFGMDLGPNTLWIIGGVGLVTFLITHWISQKISDSFSGSYGFGGDSYLPTETRFGKWVNIIIVTICLLGVFIGTIAYIVYKPPAKENPVSLMNGQFPLPKDLKIVGRKIVIEGETSDFPVASNDIEVEQILQRSMAFPDSEQKKWSDHYYTIGMRYYTTAKEQKQGWDPKACYAFARNNFTISSRLASDGTIRIESQTAMLDCLHELQAPKVYR